MHDSMIILHLDTLLKSHAMPMDVQWDIVPCVKSWFMKS